MTDGYSSYDTLPSAYSAVGDFDVALSDSDDEYSSDEAVSVLGSMVTGSAYGADEEYTFGGVEVGGSAYEAVGLSSGDDDDDASGECKVESSGYGEGYGAYNGDGSSDSESSSEDKDLDDLFDDPAKRRTLNADWNVSYQELLSAPDSLEKWSGLAKLARDFVYAANLYGSIIISEVPLSVKAKTIKPVSVGGVAGGEKFIASGILFKFALDAEGIYGGSHENAMKVAGHELRGLISIFNAGVDDLKTPLMALVDYKGFRLIAISLLPISSKTLRYGSADAARTVHDDIPALSDAMRELGKRLNLAEHTVLDKRLYGPGDIEVHEASTTGDFYVIDTSRLYPPEAPLEASWRPKAWFLYRLLRPELVGPFDTPLSSDAFTRFQLADPDRKELNKAVEVATVKLNYQIIPELAERLDELCRWSSMSDMASLNLAVEFHRHGVNMRKLGAVRSRVKQSNAKRVLATEMVTRVCKNILRERWRDKMFRLKIAREEPFVEITVAMLNLIFGFENPAESKHFWRIVKQQVLTKFDGGFTPAELAEPLRSLSVLLMSRLLHQLSLTTGFELRPGVKKDVMSRLQDQEDGQGALPSIVFVEADLKPLQPRMKQMSIASAAEARSVCLVAKEQKDESAVLRLLTLAHEKYADATTAVTTSSQLLLEWGTVLSQIAALDSRQSWGTLAEANFELAAKSEPRNVKMWKQWGSLEWANTMTRAERSLSRMLDGNCDVGHLRNATTVGEKWGRAIHLEEDACDEVILPILEPLLEGADAGADVDSMDLFVLLSASYHDR